MPSKNPQISAIRGVGIDWRLAGMSENRPITGKEGTDEARVRFANACVLFVNSILVLQLALYGGLWMFRFNVAYAAVGVWVLVGIGLAIKLCGLPRSYFLGHALLFLYMFGLFTVLIPFVGQEFFPGVYAVWSRQF